MKFIARNKNLIIITIILSILNLCFSAIPPQKKPKKKNEAVDDLPTVAPLSPAADMAVKKGNEFCEANCSINLSKRTKTCILNNKPSDCKRCTPKPKFKKDKSKAAICDNLCNSILPSKPCKFYGYFNGKLKKGINARLLNKFKLKLIRRR